MRQTAAVCINECIALVNRREYQESVKTELANYIYGEVWRGLSQETDQNYLQGVLSILC